MESFSGIVKTLIIFAVYTNDIIVQSSLKPKSKTSEEKKFFHSKNELGRFILKDCILLVNYVRADIELNNKHDTIVKKLLELSTKLMSLSFSNPDFYIVGLRRSLNHNAELYYNMINNNFTSGDERFIKFIQEKFSKMESTLFEYFNFQVKFSDLEKLLHCSVDDFFKIVGGDYKIPEIAKKFEKSKNLRPLVEYPEDSHERYRVLMNKSYFAFSIAKYLDIFYNEVQEISSQIEIENKLIDKVLKFLYFYVENNPDNCIIGLSTAILSHLSAARGPNSLNFLIFIYYCMYIIASEKYELSTTKKWLRYAHKAYINSLVNFF